MVVETLKPGLIVQKKWKRTKNRSFATLSCGDFRMRIFDDSKWVSREGKGQGMRNVRGAFIKVVALPENKTLFSQTIDYGESKKELRERLEKNCLPPVGRVALWRATRAVQRNRFR